MTVRLATDILAASTSKAVVVPGTTAAEAALPNLEDSLKMLCYNENRHLACGDGSR
jgi:hypothetical protein